MKLPSALSLFAMGLSLMACGPMESPTPDAGVDVIVPPPDTSAPPPDAGPQTVAERCQAGVRRGLDCGVFDNRRYAELATACAQVDQYAAAQTLAFCVEAAGGNCLMVNNCFTTTPGPGPGPGTTPGPYQRCMPLGATCLGSTTCQQATTTVSGAVGLFCTATCVPGGSCPASTSGLPLICVQTASGGQCYEGCSVSNACPIGFTPGSDGAGTCFCIPG